MTIFFFHFFKIGPHSRRRFRPVSFVPVWSQHSKKMLLWVVTAFAVAMAAFGFVVANKLSKWANPKLPPVPQPKRSGDKKNYSADAPEVIIIGGGVVGGTMAIQFAKQGRFVTVIERQMVAPDRIVGEFLQPGGYRKMVELGIDGTFRPDSSAGAYKAEFTFPGNATFLFHVFLRSIPLDAQITMAKWL